jgi:formylglycine-generating enzyme required for sulfatase activity
MSLCCLSFFPYANNLKIGTVTISTISGNQYLNFTISWDNSWRVSSSPNNWDAVWVFVKRRDCAGLDWSHVNLSANDADHDAGDSLFVDAYTDKKGVMIYRNADGSGNINNINVKLKLDAPPSGNYEYSVFGIEMVYIPQGAFNVGDGQSYSSLQKWPTNAPYLISSEDSIQLGQDTGKLFHIQSGTGDVGIVHGTTLSQAYPKGYNAFYCMKYEVSQGQYADFLNNIAQDAALNRYLPGNAGVERYNIQGIWPSISSTTPDRACNFMSFQDLAALLDWSALSPMTELEYEKICRGANSTPVAAEKAWGSNTATDANTVAPGTDGTPSEYVSDAIITGSGLANFAGNVTGSFSGPLRCGFAARPNSNRYQAGASYYGVMELSGNLMERCYNLAIFNNGAIGGGLFTGGEGDGELTSSPNAGYANEGWVCEGYNGGIFVDGYAAGFKGGGYIRSLERMAVSDRFFINVTGFTAIQSRVQDYGGRGVSRRQ